MQSKRMPRCVGNFLEGDTQCDGNSAGLNDADKLPCVFRDRCAALRKITEATGRPLRYYVHLSVVGSPPPTKRDASTFAFANDEEKLSEMINKTISKLGIRNGRSTQRTSPTIRPKSRPRKLTPEQLGKLRRAAKRVPSSVRRAASKVGGEVLKKARERVNELASWYTLQIQKATNRKVADSPAGARPGEIFMVDRTEASGYVALYAKLASGARRALTSILFRPMSGRLEVRIALDFAVYKGVLAKSSWEKLSPEDYTGKDGAFKIRCREVDTERATILAESLATAIERGIIDLPAQG